MTSVPVFSGAQADPELGLALQVDAPLLETWLVAFLRDECIRQRGVDKAVLGLSGGLDSALTAALCAKAFGPENVHAIRMPYRSSSPESLEDARLVVERFGIRERTIDITAMVDGYAQTFEPDLSPLRLGNVCARARMTVLFDQSAKLGALPIGTGNKTERLFGYYTWHADDAPPVNPLGDLFKTQVRALARQMGVPERLLEKPPTADLVRGQTDEGDLGISYERADRILHFLTLGYPREKLAQLGFSRAETELVWKRVAATHWKRKLPSTAVISASAIGEFYLRPVDYK